MSPLCSIPSDAHTISNLDRRTGMSHVPCPYLNAYTNNSLHERGCFQQENNTWIRGFAAGTAQKVSNGKSPANQ